MIGVFLFIFKKAVGIIHELSLLPFNICDAYK